MGLCPLETLFAVPVRVTLGGVKQLQEGYNISHLMGIVVNLTILLDNHLHNKVSLVWNMNLILAV